MLEIPESFDDWTEVDFLNHSNLFSLFFILIFFDVYIFIYCKIRSVYMGIVILDLSF
jgi:hypothetical protein